MVCGSGKGRDQHEALYIFLDVTAHRWFILSGWSVSTIEDSSILYQCNWILKLRKWGFCEGFLTLLLLGCLLDKKGIQGEYKGLSGTDEVSCGFHWRWASPGHQEIVLGPWWPQDFRVWLGSFPGLVIDSTKEEKSRLLLWATVLFIKTKDFWDVLGMGAGNSWRF